jgi:triphosphoribosyl-dephospho-CoA synthase
LAIGAETAGGGDLWSATEAAIAASTLADAEAVFRAITLAAPGGLGVAARHDVRAPATVRLPEAMEEAAGRDRIARQWITGFADVRGAVAGFAAALARWPEPRWATLAVHLDLLAAAPDSHVARKHGPAAAEALRDAAAAWPARFSAASDPEALLPDLLSWDAALKQADINPGTTADLTVATIFAHRLLIELAGRAG